ncbi:MAG: hypothetical protein ACO35E_10285, partial [Ilumatobacteraceae bacterium]
MRDRRRSILPRAFLAVAVSSAVACAGGSEGAPATEPTVQINPGDVVLVPGRPGREISMNSVVQSLPLTLDVAADRGTCEPRITSPANGAVLTAASGDADANTPGFQRGILLDTGNPI